ncbi:hypothetical protein KKF55_02905 [Patescibacteria group bacterium]|nr:hypothetical protein [Patescibacteria group bacterium]
MQNLLTKKLDVMNGLGIQASNRRVLVAEAELLVKELRKCGKHELADKLEASAREVQSTQEAARKSTVECLQSL